jgi:hypothetical protein
MTYCTSCPQDLISSLLLRIHTTSLLDALWTILGTILWLLPDEEPQENIRQHPTWGLTTDHVPRGVAASSVYNSWSSISISSRTGCSLQCCTIHCLLSQKSRIGRGTAFQAHPFEISGRDSSMRRTHHTPLLCSVIDIIATRRVSNDFRVLEA